MSASITLERSPIAAIQQRLVASGPDNFPAKRDAALRLLTSALIKVPGGADVSVSLNFKNAEAKLRAFNFSSVPDGELDGLVKDFSASVDNLLATIPEDMATNARVGMALRQIKGLKEEFAEPLGMYISAQKDIALGFHGTLEHTLDLLGIPFTIWSSKGLNSDNKDWGPVFAGRIQYIKRSGGSITFYGKDVDPGNNLTRERTEKAMDIWSNCRGPIKERYQQFLSEYEKEMGNLKGSTTYFELAYLLEEGMPFDSVDFSFSVVNLP
jgi:hypothetical protein